MTAPVGDADALGPRLRISLSALRANAAQMDVADGPIVDLRRDALGHGVALVAPILREAGVTRAVLDDEAPDAIAAGMERVEGPPTLDLPRLLGLPGSGGSPVSSLVSGIASTKPLLAGEGVSYGFSHRAETDTRIGLVAGGYSHGIVRALGNAAEVVVRGSRRPIVGRVAMDVLVVDLGATGAVPGDEVVLFGDGGRGEPSLAEWTAITGMTPAELLTAVALGCPHEVVP